MPAVAALVPSAEAAQTLRRSLPAGGPCSLVICRSPATLRATLDTRLVDAVVFSPTSTPLQRVEELRTGFPHIPWMAFAPFRPDDAATLHACQDSLISLVLVQGVDDAVAGDLVVRASAGARRKRALQDGPRALRLQEPLQQQVWFDLLDRVDRPIRTEEIARRMRCSREHLSRQFGAGGAPNLKRVIDLTRVACAASLLRNPGYNARTVARILGFATASHLSATARRITGLAARSLAGLGPKGVLAAFVRGKTRSRL